jgi:predicted transposase YdaD
MPPPGSLSGTITGITQSSPAQSLSSRSLAQHSHCHHKVEPSSTITVIAVVPAQSQPSRSRAQHNHCHHAERERKEREIDERARERGRGEGIECERERERDRERHRVRDKREKKTRKISPGELAIYRLQEQRPGDHVLPWRPHPAAGFRWQCR